MSSSGTSMDFTPDSPSEEEHDTKVEITKANLMELLDSTAFHDIVGMIPEKNVKDSLPQITKAIDEAAVSVKEKIKKELEGRMLVACVNVTLYGNDIYAALDVHLIKNGILQKLTLALKKWDYRNPAFITHLVETALEKFDISHRLTTVIDVPGLITEHKEYVDDPRFITQSIEADKVFWFMDVENEDGEWTVCAQIMPLHDEIYKHHHILRCPSRTLPSLMSCALVDESIKKVTIEAKNLVKYLVQPAVRYLLQMTYGIVVVLHTYDGRHWLSITNMLQKIKEMKYICDTWNNPHLILSENFWDKVIKICNSLQIIRQCTERLERKNLLFGDVYQVWKKCLLDITKTENEYAEIFYSKLYTPLSSLFDSDILMATNCLDPRYKQLLPSDMIAMGKRRLVETYKELVSSKGEEKDEIPAKEHRNESDEPQVGRKISIEEEIDDFLKEPTLPIETDVLAYWNKKPCELQKLANVFLAIPLASSSKKHVDTGGRIISSSKRLELDPKVVENILIVHLNC